MEQTPRTDLESGPEGKKATPSLKSYHMILREEIVVGLRELKRPAGGLFLSSLSAGLDVGFSLLLMGVALTVSKDALPEPATRFLVANMYSVGFILVILGRSELFTEHTSLAVLPVLDRRASLASLGRLWGVVFGGNIVGATIFAAIAAFVGPGMGVIEPWALEEIATKLVDHDAWVIVLSAILAGWLMGELAWLIASGRETVSQLLFVWIIATAIGFAQLHHSIAGTVEVLAGCFVSPDLTMGDFWRFLGLTTFGNAVGGVVFVAIIKYGHAIRHSEQGTDTERS